MEVGTDDVGRSCRGQRVDHQVDGSTVEQGGDDRGVAERTADEPVGEEAGELVLGAVRGDDADQLVVAETAPGGSVVTRSMYARFGTYAVSANP